MPRLPPHLGVLYLFQNQMHLPPAVDDLLWSVTCSLTALVVTLWVVVCSTVLRRVVLGVDKVLKSTVYVLGQGMDAGVSCGLSVCRKLS